MVKATPSFSALAIFTCTPLIWGLTFPTIKSALHYINPVSFVFLRFALAALLLLPMVKFRKQHMSRSLMISGGLLGLLNAITYYSQTLGLATISASESAFITALSVVMVPFIASLSGFSRIKALDFAAALLCLLGIGCLTGTNISQLNIGHLYTFICALSVALSILVVQRASETRLHLVNFSFIQIVFTIVFMLPSEYQLHETLAHLASTLSHWSVILTLLYCASIATVLAIFLQTKYQKEIGECRAAIILSAEPLFASTLSILFFGEQFSYHLLAGGLLMLLSLLLMELPALFAANKKRINHALPGTQS